MHTKYGKGWGGQKYAVCIHNVWVCAVCIPCVLIKKHGSEVGNEVRVCFVRTESNSRQRGLVVKSCDS